MLTQGLSDRKDWRGRTMQELMFAAARPHLLRVLGPNSGGIIVPGWALNASFAHTDALPGKIAFVAQSDALASAVLDWTKSKGVGFSCFLHLGESADIDLGDVLDYLASDADTSSILVQMESTTAARKFMSASRAAARKQTSHPRQSYFFGTNTLRASARVAFSSRHPGSVLAKGHRQNYPAPGQAIPTGSDGPE